MYRINLELTGKKLNRILTKAGISARQIQNMLSIGSVQSVYRWYRGETLPTVDHLYDLSRILNCHMEELLAFSVIIPKEYQSPQILRFMSYYEQYQVLIA